MHHYTTFDNGHVTSRASVRPSQACSRSSMRMVVGWAPLLAPVGSSQTNAFLIRQFTRLIFYIYILC